MAYQPCARFRRTPAERADETASWNRSDQAFFAAGACHILAFAFLGTYPAAGFHPVGLWPHDDQNPHHVYVTDGIQAFDHDGWTPEIELLTVTNAAEPDAHYRAQPVEPDLDALCVRHRLRPRHMFAFDPWQRAQHYLTLFPPPPA